MNSSSAPTDKFINDVFGTGGPVSCPNKETYEQLLVRLIRKWDRLKIERQRAEFSSYFVTYKAEDVYEHMRVELSRSNGFGNQIKTTHPIESDNAVVKNWNNFEPRDMSTFLDSIKALIANQQTNVAFIGLSSDYNQNGCSKNIMFTHAF